LKYSESTRNYAIQIAKHNKAHLVGIFLEDFTYHSYKVYDLIREESPVTKSKQQQLDKKDDDTRAAAVQNFATACQNEGLEYSLHRDRNIAIQELLHESIYADLLVICVTETLTHYAEKVPTRFIRDLLSNTQCPVMAVPHKYKPVNKLVLLYDGAPSSVHAIKMFSYTLPAMKQNPAEVLSVIDASQSGHVPDNRLMKEFMKRHYPTAIFKVLKGAPEIEIVDYLKKQTGNPLIVAGAYRRGMVSRWFRQSMADALMKDLKLPLFIAHNK
jgi:nucleotide-binding universal stress UspA family protein